MERSNPLQVVIAGGGVAGLEALIALRSLAGGRVEITLVAPEDEFVYRPQSVGEPFGMAPPQRHPLQRIAADFGAKLVADRVERVEARAQRVQLEGGAELAYDSLVVAVGARQVPAWPHVLTFGGPGDSEAMRALVSDLGSGSVQSAAFVVPTGVTWPLPLYELALMSARRARSAEIAIFTPEREPLAIFGPDAGQRLAAELDAVEVRVARSASVDITPDGDVVLPHDEWPLRFERVVALPRLAGRPPAGLPHDDDGFIPIDSHCTVRGLRHVYAAGDGTDYPVKQGGIAAQQAEAAAEAIAKVAGAGNMPRPFSAVLRAELFTGRGSRFLRGDMSERATSDSAASYTPLWWPVGKIAGRHLAPYLATADSGRDVVAAAPAWIEESPYGE
jgi:sulfide:quinone oxidoreductase